jgi:hypothetical protein
VSIRSTWRLGSKGRLTNLMAQISTDAIILTISSRPDASLYGRWRNASGTGIGVFDTVVTQYLFLSVMEKRLEAGKRANEIREIRQTHPKMN